MRPPLLLALVAALIAPALSGAQSDTTLRIPGLRASVALERDAAGIVHITAANEHDLFFAQGWSVARDRLFQLEMWRRRATGTMAGVIGTRGVPMDIASRRFRFRGDLNREMTTYHPRGAAIIGAFVEGINAYIDATSRDAALLPPQFALLGITPGRWTPAIVLSRHNGLFIGGDGEASMAQVVAAVGPERARALYELGPAEPRLRGDSTLDYARLPFDVLRAQLTALRGAIPFVPADIVAPAAGPGDAGWQEGSNNWAVAGTRTASGKPLLANDPHRDITIPSLRYYVHLRAPGWNVIGAGEPVLPGVAIGHNEHGAWGLTIFAIDGEDILEYDTDPADSLRYRYGGGWERMRTERESIAVRGGATRAVPLAFTRHGPVIAFDAARHKAWSYRTTMLEYGTAPYLASLRFDQARTWAEFRAACAFAFAPPENMVWADTSGTIGWQVVGKAPLRRNFSGLLPMPGDGRYEWAGFLPTLDLPHDTNPARGFVHSANENNVPAGYAHLDAVGHDWADTWRAERIAEVLRAGSRLQVADMTALQYDPVSLPARTLVPLVRGAPVAGALALAARDTLLAWDQRMLAASAGAGIYAAYESHLRKLVTERLVPATVRVALKKLELVVATRWLTGMGALGPDSVRARDALVARALGDAAAELAARFGPSIAAWNYGQALYHRAGIPSALGPALDSAPRSAARTALRAALDAGPAPIGGNGSTVWVTGDADEQTWGASFRLVADLADWERSVGTNAPGQSGDPRSPHYRDLFAPWVDGRYFPLPFSEQAVHAAARETVRLLPRTRR
ncbi:MAG: penicillin acylase family protein [Gemmatimonadetes bacterium]|nr:penicillin acylase family protein [Gemmatimonadota bacterium]